MSMSNWERRQIVERYPVRALRAAVQTALREVGATAEWSDAPAVAWTGSPERRVRIPRPISASTAATGLHEIAHQKFHRHMGPEEVAWRGELRACQWALEWWNELELPDREQAAYSLGEPLHGYLQLALERGEVTMREIEDEVPGELMPYRRRLDALARHLDRQRRLEAGEYVERSLPERVW